jgi:predicted kinase
MSKLIVVCGLPGSGKTTLAKELSKKLNIVHINKDSIKEALYEIENLSTLDHSKEVGFRAFLLEMRLAEEQISNNVDLILESPFRHEQDQQQLVEWQEKYQLNLYSIICQIPENERNTRFRSRPRHKAHHDHERDFEIHDDPDSFYKNMPGQHLWLTTNKPVSNLIEEVCSKFNL